MIISPIIQLLDKESQLGCVVEELAGGLSDSFVYKVNNDYDTRVIKIQKNIREVNFLTNLAPRLFEGVNWLPLIHSSGTIDDWNWMEFEYLPLPWPRERYSFDKEALTTLRHLHSIPIKSETFDWANLHWTREQISISWKYLPGSTCQCVESIYEAYLDRSQKNLSLCSGDPNVPNWMIRKNGEIVLIDWQQVTMSNRALDIAGWIATMLDFQKITDVARVYLGNPSHMELVELARDIAIFFTRRCVTNFWFAEHSAFPEKWKEGNEYMRKVFPDWVSSIVRDAKLN